MRPFLAALCLVALTVPALLPFGALAQEKLIWAKIDCAQSKIQGGPPGMLCNATQEYSGGTFSEAKINTKGVGAGGQFRHWSKHGIVNGVKYFYFLKEATTTGSSILSTRFELTVKETVVYGHGATDFTVPSLIEGGEFLKFVDRDGENCMTTRKVGTVAGNAGNRWYLLSTKCVRKGRTIPDTDAPALMASVDVSTAGF
jgi:hypothetical protein